MSSDPCNNAIEVSSSSTVGRAALGKNARKRQDKMLADEKKKRALDKVSMPDFPTFKLKPAPAEWLIGHKPYLVVARIPRMIPEHFMERLVIWMKAFMGGMLGYLATEKDLDAAKGINLMDLVPRFALAPLASFDTMEEAGKFTVKAAEYYEAVSVQTMTLGEFNVVPPYTTNGIIYAQTEMAEFMKNYAKQERMDREAFNARVAELKPELDRIAAKRGTVTQEQLDAEDKARAKEQEGQIKTHGMHMIKTEADAEMHAEAARVTAIAKESGEEDVQEKLAVGDWRAFVARSDDPLRTLSIEHNHTVATIGVRQRQIETLQAAILELMKKASEIEDRIAEFKDDKPPASDHEEEEPTLKQKIRRLVRSPTGQVFKVLLDGTAVPLASDETEDSFLYEDEPLVEESTPRPPDNEEENGPMHSGNRMQRYKRNLETAKAIPGVHDDVVLGAGAEMYQDRIGESFKIIADHNAAVLARRAEFEAQQVIEEAKIKAEKDAQKAIRDAARAAAAAKEAQSV